MAKLYRVVKQKEWTAPDKKLPKKNCSADQGRDPRRVIALIGLNPENKRP